MASSNPRSSPAMSHSSTGAKSPATKTSTIPLDSGSRFASESQFDPNQPIELSGPDHKPVFPPKYTKRPPSYPTSASQPTSAETYQSRDVGTGRLYYHNQGPDEPPRQGTQQMHYTQPPQDYYRPQVSRQPIQPVQHQPAHYAAQEQYYQGGQVTPRQDEYYHVQSHAPPPQGQYYQERRQDSAPRMQEDFYQGRQSLDQQQQYYHGHARPGPQGGAQIKIEPDDIDHLISRATPEKSHVSGKGSRA